MKNKLLLYLKALILAKLYFLAFNSHSGCIFECLWRQAVEFCNCHSWKFPTYANESDLCDHSGNVCFDEISLRPSVYVCLCLSLSVSVYLCLSLSVFVCTFLSLSVFVCLCLSLPVSLCLSFCLFLFLSLSVSLSLSIFMSSLSLTL